MGWTARASQLTAAFIVDTMIAGRVCALDFANEWSPLAHAGWFPGPEEVASACRRPILITLSGLGLFASGLLLEAVRSTSNGTPSSRVRQGIANALLAVGLALAAYGELSGVDGCVIYSPAGDSTSRDLPSRP